MPEWPASAEPDNLLAYWELLYDGRRCLEKDGLLLRDDRGRDASPRENGASWTHRAGPRARLMRRCVPESCGAKRTGGGGGRGSVPRKHASVIVHGLVGSPRRSSGRGALPLPPSARRSRRRRGESVASSASSRSASAPPPRRGSRRVCGCWRLRSKKQKIEERETSNAKPPGGAGPPSSAERLVAEDRIERDHPRHTLEAGHETSERLDESGRSTYVAGSEATGERPSSVSRAASRLYREARAGSKSRRNFASL